MQPERGCLLQPVHSKTSDEPGDVDLQIGVILTYAEGTPELPSRVQLDSDFPTAKPAFATLDILGSTLLERTVAKLHALDALPPVVLREGSSSGQILPKGSTTEINVLAGWEDAVARLVNGGAETICLVRTGAYTDLDFAELLRFHLQLGSPVTQAYSRSGPLNIAMVDASRLRGSEGAYRKILGGMMAEQSRFSYRGYVNTLNSLADYHRLAQDGLSGRCGLRPAGTEIREHVWVAEQTQLDSTAQISGPAFVGHGSCIRAGCTLRGGATIERNCEIDCGSLVENSCVLQNTYVGVALDIRGSVVKGNKLFHLDRNVEITIADQRLVGTQSSPSSLLAMLRNRLEGMPPIRAV